MKHQWRTDEKSIYLPQNQPESVNIGEQRFITLWGKGNPNDAFFSRYIEALYALAYGIKMGLKKSESKPKGYMDWTVYPLEGIWDIEERKGLDRDGPLNKENLVFNLMIRQPDFVEEDLVYEMIGITKKKKPNELLDKIKFQKITDGRSIQMMHMGSYDEEPKSFQKMEALAEELHLIRTSKAHREIYLSDFRKVETSKLKTVLRFGVKEK